MYAEFLEDESTRPSLTFLGVLWNSQDFGLAWKVRVFLECRLLFVSPGFS